MIDFEYDYKRDIVVVRFTNQKEGSHNRTLSFSSQLFYDFIATPTPDGQIIRTYMLDDGIMRMERYRIDLAKFKEWFSQQPPVDQP